MSDDLRDLRESGRLVVREMPDGSTVEMVAKSGHLKGVNVETREVVITASDNSVDRYGDVIEAAGWDTQNFERNPVSLVDHDYSVASIVGHISSTWVEGSRFMARVQLDPPEDNPAAADVLKKIKNGSLRAVSVGFRAGEREKIVDKDSGEWTGGFRFKSQELLELSWVAIPANPNATLAVEDQAAPSSEDDREGSSEAAIERLTQRAAEAALIGRLLLRSKDDGIRQAGESPRRHHGEHRRAGRGAEESRGEVRRDDEGSRGARGEARDDREVA